VAQYYAAFLILSGLMIGVFAAADALLFYIFFEATLIPMYIIVGVWGGPNRVYAAFKFFLYTLAGSLLMLVALIYLYYASGGSFDLATWRATKLGYCCSSHSLPPLRSRCRCGRCTPGCPTPTSRRPPAARSCWRPSC
jgi:NADH:ubiquinone oxidoreductase subunit 4 (subunit M)